MIEDNVPKRLRTRLLVAVSSMTLVLVFFLAPIVPVDNAFSCIFQGHYHYTDWQSPSYYLFKFGYDSTPSRPMCLGG